MPEELKVVVIPDTLGRVSRYIRDVLSNGHILGVLSGAESRYARQPGYYYKRRRAIAFAAEHGVYSGYAVINSRRYRVWHDADGNRVRINLVTPAEMAQLD